ncbi:glycosyl hydrolase [uncultured Proteiniphilum sp.]|uniref:glycosyl hydrolase n=1 Tax=uncultured Proteiniphilum sp. TaxID=497637 RepID=UPI0026095590|nr:glycosyl hydrolase [uncultured Proteiniphilum sp.]
MKTSLQILLVLAGGIFFTGYSYLNSQEDTDTPLNKEVFKSPGKDHYPETWFHFIGGNVSKEGITDDLEAIAAAGISGIQLFHGQFGGEWPGVSPQIKALSESWDELIVWTAEECKRLDLKFTMQNCPGWSYAGGPWIEPENAMRHLVRSRTDISGGQTVNIRLEKPQPSEDEGRNYKDLFVIAFPTPEGDTGTRLIPAGVQSNRPDLAWKECLSEQRKLMIPPSLSGPTTIDIDFEEETTIRTVEFPPVNSFSHAWSYSPDITVTIYAETGSEIKQIAHVEMPPGSWQDDQPVSIACVETTAQSYRIEITNLHEMAISYLNFYSAARRQNWESEAAWTLRRIMREEHPEQSGNTWVDPSIIVDITSKMDPEGVLAWDAPEGKWTVLRIGHVNTGMKNGPAPAEATGWECNKLDTSGARANFEGYIGRLMNDNNSLKNGLLNGILIDSWECKTQTWTAGLDNTFQEKWNYSLFPMFPALFGYVVKDPETTARFLRDWRVTLNDLLVKNFFGEMSSIAQKNGLELSFETASGDIFPGDILEYYKYADVPMCEFWHPRQESYVGSIEFKPVKPCVSASRVYGKKRTAAEAFTSFDLSWNEHPRFLKDIADEHLARGVTHLVFHTYTHNPRTDFLPPATSFGSTIGTPFLRLQTWWQHMPHFTGYLARCNYMLESGSPVSDVLMYLGDEQNHKPRQSLDFPEGYAYDYCNPDVLLNRLSVKNGQLVTPEGISYRVLWLYDCKRMLPETVEKILSFAKQGVTIVGEPPAGIATLRGGKVEESRFQKAVEALWGDGRQNVRTVGKGKVYRGDIGPALISEKIHPDISVQFFDVRWLHRKTKDSDFYFLSAPQGKEYKGTVSFRCTGSAEIWDPLTGETRPVASETTEDGYTHMEMDLPAGTSCFVVFHESTVHPEKSLSATEKTEIQNDWKVSFPTGWGIEQPPVEIDQLTAWKDIPSLSAEGKAFSGTAVYRTTFHIEDKPEGTRYLLDLGRVEMIAKVRLNGSDVATRWTYPYIMDITGHLQTGENNLEIAVTSTWFNRLAYDAGLPEQQRKTWTISGPEAGSPLKDYGLLGPVSILMEIN